MKAMIFAAGLGTRLYPITKDRPKALAEVNGLTLLEYNIRFIAAQGFDKIIINVHHYADKLIDFLKVNHNFGLPIELSYEQELLDTAGGLAKVAGFFDDEDFLLYNVDVISSIDLRKMLVHHQQTKALATLAIRQRPTSRYLLFDENMHLAGWRNKSTGDEILVKNYAEDDELSEFAFSGIHILSPKILPLLGEVRKHSLTPFYLEIAKDNILAGYEHNEDTWFDCGKPETLKQAENYLLKK